LTFFYLSSHHASKDFILLVYFTTMGPETNQGLRGPGHDDDEAAKVQNQVPHHCDAEETLVRNHLSTFIAHNQISLDDILKLVHMSEWINTSGDRDPLIKNATAKTQQGSVPNIEMDIAEMYEKKRLHGLFVWVPEQKLFQTLCVAIPKTLGITS